MAFTGKTTHDQISEMAEDVSPMIGMISPFETPLLDRLGDSPQPARNTLHEWVEDGLSPGTVIASSAINSAVAATVINVNGTALNLQLGDILWFAGASSLTYSEYIQVDTAPTNANSISVTRNFGSKGVGSSAAGATLELISNASLEGDDVQNDISQNRSRNFNIVQQFAKPVQVSDTKRAVSQVAGVTDEFDYQVLNRMREIMRDLERAAIRGVRSGNTYGSDTTFRTTGGIDDYLTTNVASIATLNTSWLDNVVIKAAWDQGARDLDVIVAGGTWKHEVDGFASDRIRIEDTTDRYRQVIGRYESSFGLCDVLPANHNMRGKSLVVIASGRMRVMPLQNRSFQNEARAKTGKATKSEIVGEYVVEIKNEEGMARVIEAA